MPVVSVRETLYGFCGETIPDTETRQKIIRVMMEPGHLRSFMTRSGLVLNEQDKKPCLYIVYCGGKCGSTSLHKAFQQCSLPSVRIHNKDHFVDEYVPFLKNDPRLRSTLHLDTLLEFFLNFYETIVVLDAYRDPIERKLSSFFQNFHVNLRRAHVNVAEWGKMTIEQQMEVFEVSIMNLLEQRHGIDTVYKYFFHAPFDFHKRYQKLHHQIFPSVTLLKLRFCDIGSWEHILKSVLGITHKDFHITRENSSSTKEYALEYTKWVYGFQPLYFSTVWKLVFSPVFTKYHTPNETEMYMKKWYPFLAKCMNAVAQTPPERQLRMDLLEKIARDEHLTLPSQISNNGGNVTPSVQQHNIEKMLEKVDKYRKLVINPTQKIVQSVSRTHENVKVVHPLVGLPPPHLRTPQQKQWVKKIEKMGYQNT